MKTILWAIVCVSLFVLMGCDKRDADNNENWIHLTGYDFPINMSHFADYDSTDQQGNFLGHVQYGSDGDNKDWQLFEYNDKSSSVPAMITGLSMPGNQAYNPVFQSVNYSHGKSDYGFGYDAHGYIHPGVPETIVPDSLFMNLPFIFKTPSLQEVSSTPVIEYQVFPGLPIEISSKQPIYQYAFGVKLFTASQTDHSKLTVTVPPGTWFALAFYNNDWNAATPCPVIGPREITWNDIPFSDTVSVVFSGGDPFQPPFMGNFAAEVTNDYQVELTWVTESETDVQGYNIFRCENNDISNAVVINDSLITIEHPPYQQCTYTFMDDTAELSHTYYYWLQQCYSSNQPNLFGPVYAHVIYTGDNPSENKVYPAYPNSCTDWITLPYSITDSARVTIVILSKDNQAVISWQNYYAPGSYHVDFNLGDLPAGIYRVYYWIKMTNKSYYSYGDVLKQ